MPTTVLPGWVAAVARVAGRVAMVTGLTVLVGWWAQVPALTTVLAGHAAMKPNAALGAVLAGLVLQDAGRTWRWRRPVLLALCTAITLIGVLTSLEWLLHVDLHLDQVLAHDRAASDGTAGRMSPQMAVELALFGIARACVRRRGRGLRTLVATVATIAFAVLALATDLGFVFGAGEVTANRWVTAVSLPSVCVLPLLLIGLLALQAEHRPVRWLFGHDATGALMRRLLPAALVLPPVIGMVCVLGEDRGWYGGSAAGALFAGSMVVVFVALTSFTAFELAAMERQRGEMTRQVDALFEHIPASLSLRDLSGRYLRANDNLARRRGVTAEAMVGRTLYDFYPRELADLFLEHDEMVARTLQPDVETYEVGDGPNATRHTETTRFPVFDGCGALLGVGTFALDVTERVRAEREAEAAAERLATFLASIPDATVVVDPTGTIRYANEQVTTVLGYTVTELVGQKVEILVPDGPRPRHVALRGGYNHERRPMGGLDLTARHRDGREIPVDISLGPVGSGPDAWTLASIRDVTEKRAAQDLLRAAEERYRHLAEHDPLTGLWNRRRFEEELEAHLALCQRGDAGGALLSLDLDHFKDVNDTFGHHVGDQLLRNVAEAMRSTMRASDGIARQGGDEFLVLLRSGDERAARRVADALVATVRRTADLLADRVAPTASAVTASVGVVAFERLAPADLNSQTVLIRADLALYAAKGQGRDRSSVAV